MLAIDWSQFDSLKDFAFKYLRTRYKQDATMIGENAMVLQLLQLVFYLLQGGFYTADEVVSSEQ